MWTPFGWADPAAGSELTVTIGVPPHDPGTKISTVIGVLRVNEPMRLAFPVYIPRTDADPGDRYEIRAEIEMEVFAMGSGRVLRIYRAENEYFQDSRLLGLKEGSISNTDIAAQSTVVSQDDGYFTDAFKGGSKGAGGAGSGPVRQNAQVRSSVLEVEKRGTVIQLPSSTQRTGSSGISNTAVNLGISGNASSTVTANVVGSIKGAPMRGPHGRLLGTKLVALSSVTDDGSVDRCVVGLYVFVSVYEHITRAQH